MVCRFSRALVYSTRVMVPVTRPSLPTKVTNEKSALPTKVQKKMELKPTTPKPICATALSAVVMPRENGTRRGGGANRSDDGSMAKCKGYAGGHATACNPSALPAGHRVR